MECEERVERKKVERDVYALIEYKKEHEDCNVPTGWTENKQLATWVSVQRRSYKNGNLAEDYIKRLENIGFIRNPLESKWEEMFESLVEYKKDHGDCNVPQGRSEVKQLASWVNTQRINYRKGRLAEDQIKRLEDIGFMWNIHK